MYSVLTGLKNQLLSYEMLLLLFISYELWC